MTRIELIARAVIRKGDRILLAHKKGEPNTFLPGGHIEPKEYAEEALRRELHEELGVKAMTGDFVGILEHKFTDEHDMYHEEMNLIFETSIDSEIVASSEKHLEFIWVKPMDFEKQMLLPSSLQWLLPEYFENGVPFHYVQRV